MWGGQRTTRGLRVANRQLLLASKLTYDRERATGLADLAHAVGELDGTDRAALRRVDDRLDTLADGTHDEVRAAIRRGRRLLRSHQAELVSRY